MHTLFMFIGSHKLQHKSKDTHTVWAQSDVIAHIGPRITR